MIVTIKKLTLLSSRTYEKPSTSFVMGFTPLGKGQGTAKVVIWHPLDSDKTAKTFLNCSWALSLKTWNGKSYIELSMDRAREFKPITMEEVKPETIQEDKNEYIEKATITYDNDKPMELDNDLTNIMEGGENK